LKYNFRNDASGVVGILWSKGIEDVDRIRGRGGGNGEQEVVRKERRK
jgi:hypothetical protein